MVVAPYASGLHVVLGAVCMHVFNFYRRGDDFGAREGELGALRYDALVRRSTFNTHPSIVVQRHSCFRKNPCQCKRRPLGPFPAKLHFYLFLIIFATL